jgi:hypothetical protein
MSLLYGSAKSLDVVGHYKFLVSLAVADGSRVRRCRCILEHSDEGVVMGKQ